VTGAAQLADLVAALRAVLPPDRDLCADHEGGPVSFLQAAAGRPPAARSLGRLDDLALTGRVVEATATRARAAGIDRLLAPVCDVLATPHNPVIGARAFGDDAEVVARHAGAAAAALRAAGVQGCAKHWPDHGGTAVDTHEQAARPVAAPSAAFGPALAAGLDAVMVGHLATGHGRPPLTLDREGLRELRRTLGSRVALWSDDVSMGALRGPLQAAGIGAGDGRSEGLADPARLPLAWLEACAAAGCDRLLLRGIPWSALPPDDGEVGPPLPDAATVAAPLATPVPAAEAWDEVRARIAAPVQLAPGAGRLLWFDTTAADRLGAAAPALGPLVAGAWPDHVRLDVSRPRLAPGPPFGRLLVTSHRPLSLGQAQLLEPLAAALGTALAAGHPSLVVDLARLLGPGWRIDALDDCSPADLAAVIDRPNTV
jgi:hypothetical protein